MHQLVGRLTALDPEASESLKVIAYFDALVDGHANVEVLLRGAAVLSGCAAGFAISGLTRRVDASGRPSAIDSASAATPWPRHALGPDGHVWIERDGAAHANDDMILERLAIAVAITQERSTPVIAQRRAVETVLDESAAVADRLAAAALLRLDPARRFEVSALPATDDAPTGYQTVLVTRAGVVRAVIRPAGHPADTRQPTDTSQPADTRQPTDTSHPTDTRHPADTAGSQPAPGARVGAHTVARRVGVGFAVMPGELDRSWHSALLALRMTGPREPILRADGLGALLMLAEAADDRAHEHPDVTALKAVMTSSASAREVIEAVAATESARAAARELGLHHSTVQARLAELSLQVGFDVRTPAGRTRLGLALRLCHLATNSFD